MMSGISQVSGYVGGVIATTPLAAAVSGFGWRACFLFIACIGLANLAFAKLTLKPDPVSHSNKTLKGVMVAARRALGHRRQLGLRNDLCVALRGRHHAVGRLGHSDGCALLPYLPDRRRHALLAFMIGNALGSVFLGSCSPTALRQALDRALIQHLRVAHAADRDAGAAGRP